MAAPILQFSLRRFIDSQNYDGAGMADNITPCPDAPGLFDFFRGYGKYRAVITDARRKNASLLRSYRCAFWLSQFCSTRFFVAIFVWSGFAIRTIFRTI